MKKKMIALLAGALMMISASSAFAFYAGDLELYRVVFDSTTSSTFQTITDLGSLSSVTAKASATGTLLDSGTSAFTSVTGYSNASLSNLRIAYFAYNATSPNQDVYLSQKSATAPTINGLKWSTAGLGLKTVAGNALTPAGTSLDTSGMTVYGQSNTYANGFKVKENTNFGGYFSGTAATLGEPSLATLAATDKTYIYFFDQSNTGQTGVAYGNFYLTTNVSNGTTTVHSASAVPIPPAFFLMGSGLLGMIGLRRRMS